MLGWVRMYDGKGGYDTSSRLLRGFDEFGARLSLKLRWSFDMNGKYPSMRKNLLLFLQAKL